MSERERDEHKACAYVNKHQNKNKFSENLTKIDFSLWSPHFSNVSIIQIHFMTHRIVCLKMFWSWNKHFQGVWPQSFEKFSKCGKIKVVGLVTKIVIRTSHQQTHRFSWTLSSLNQGSILTKNHGSWLNSKSNWQSQIYSWILQKWGSRMVEQKSQRPGREIPES